MAQVTLYLAGMLHDPGCENANITATTTTCGCPPLTHFRAMVSNTLMGQMIKGLAGFPPGWVDHNLIFAGRDISRENHTLSQLGGGAQGDEFFIRVALDSPGDDNPEVQDAANAAATAAAAADAADAAAAAAAAAAATAAAPAAAAPPACSPHY